MTHRTPNSPGTCLTVRLSAGLLVPVFLCAGCHLLQFGWTDQFTDSAGRDRKRSNLPALKRARDTVGLEIVFAERPVDDPLLGDSQLWEGIDTVGELSPELRKRLRQDGWKVGHMSATPNAAVESLLGLTSQSTGTRAPVGRMQLAGQRLFRPVGGDTEVQTSRYFPTVSVKLGEESSEAFRAENARCVMRVTVQHLDEGFARLEFAPEIHHGRLGWRPVATEQGLQGTTAQKIQHLYSRRFTITLNAGEMAVITADPARPDSLGSLFFVDGDRGGRTQRVLFVRLADVARSAAVVRRSSRANRDF